MPGPNFAPTLSFISALSGSPLRPLHTFVRTAEEHFRPSHVRPHLPKVQHAQTAVLKRNPSAFEFRARVLREVGVGRVPTIVLGGLVPDSSEQVFLLRRFLLKAGDLYYINYPRTGFSLELVCAQLADLVAELTAAGQPPIVFGVSFGAGVAVDWLRRARLAGTDPLLAGLVLVSPVTCVADLIAPGAAKPATLIGRALKPFLDPTRMSEEMVEKSRMVFLRMFEAGAQNKAALRLLMTARESERLRAAVMATIRGITWRGSCESVQALASMVSPTDYFSPTLLPLTSAPTLVLFAEREEAVLDECAPALFAFERAPQAYFSQGVMQRVKARAGEPAVQHASLIFHVFEFLSPLQSFYQHVRRRPLALAA